MLLFPAANFFVCLFEKYIIIQYRIVNICFCSRIPRNSWQLSTFVRTVIHKYNTGYIFEVSWFVWIKFLLDILMKVWRWIFNIFWRRFWIHPSVDSRYTIEIRSFSCCYSSKTLLCKDALSVYYNKNEKDVFQHQLWDLSYMFGKKFAKLIHYIFNLHFTTFLIFVRTCFWITATSFKLQNLKYFTHVLL